MQIKKQHKFYLKKEAILFFTQVFPQMIQVFTQKDIAYLLYNLGFFLYFPFNFCFKFIVKVPL